MNWLEQEESLVALGHRQVRRLLARSRCRPVATACLAAVIGLVIFAAQARRPKLYEAEVGLLITEGAFAPDGRPRPRGELRAFVNDVAFSNARLDDLVRKHDLLPWLGTTNREAALTSMRKLIKVNTWHDYFEGYRQHADPPRTARVTIEFTATEPALALAVARDLGELLAETQTARESEKATARVEELRVLMGSAAAEAARRRAEQERAERAGGERPDPASLWRVQKTMQGLETAENTSRAVTAELISAQLYAQTVGRVGSRVQVVDPGIPPWRTATRAERLMRQVTLAALVSVPLVIMLIGAFDPTVRDEQDLVRIGMRLLGRVPGSSERVRQAGV
jgi:hypothetical protein